MEELSAEKFRKFTDILFDVLGKNDVDVNRLIEAKEAVLRNTEEYKNRSEKELRAIAYSEVVAEMMEPVLTDTDAISRISQKIKQQDRSLWGKIKDFIKGIVEKLKAAYRDMEPDSAIARLTRETVTNSEAVLDAFSEAAADAVLNYNLQEGQKNNAREGERYSPRMTSDMTEQERYDKLKNLSLTVMASAKKNAVADAEEKYGTAIKDGTNLKATDRKKLFKKIGELFNVYTDYDNRDIDLTFTFSGENMRESISKQKRYYYSFLKMLSCFGDVIDSAIGIETHNRNEAGYKVDPTLKNVYVMVSAFQDGENITPVKLEIKEFSDKPNTLYVAIALDSIQKGKLSNKNSGIVTEGNTVSGVTQSAPPLTISLADLFANVNPQDSSFLKYVPTQFLTEQQRAGEKYSSREGELSERALKNSPSDVKYSLRRNGELQQKAEDVNREKGFVSEDVMDRAAEVRNAIANIMLDPELQESLGLPPDVEGNTFFADSSYGGTEENTTICPRSMGAEALLDAVSDLIGRPLTVDEQIVVSQEMANLTRNPECVYCYVATDRKAYREFLGEYIKQRDQVLKDASKYTDTKTYTKAQIDGMSDAQKANSLYVQFLNGRKPTKNMASRFKMWMDISATGERLLQASDLTSISRLEALRAEDFTGITKDMAKQIKDAMRYAQSASWAKKRVGYTAYNGHILNWKQSRIDNLNSQYGLRMYSFSDFSPAFILENMQMVTDAAAKGLKMLAYTKDLNFVKIFAKTGMNINVSCFGFEHNGEVSENNLMGADWAEARKLRAENPNVGIVFVTYNDAMTKWAMKQEWVDVVIPYHLVRTGTKVATAYGFTTYTDISGDKKITESWVRGQDAAHITPPMHENNLDKYLAACEENHLTPRFQKFLNDPELRPYYMKLVNETRRSAQETPTVQPVFDQRAAEIALQDMRNDGGYFQPIGGSVNKMIDIAMEISEKIQKENGDNLYSARNPQAQVEAENERLKSDVKRQIAEAVREYRRQQDVQSKAYRQMYERQLEEVKKSYQKQISTMEAEYSANLAQIQDAFFQTVEAYEKGQFRNEHLEKVLKQAAETQRAQAKASEADNATWEKEFNRLLKAYETSGRNVERLKQTVETQRARAKAKVEAARVTEQRGKLYRAVNEINRRLLNPTKTLYVPDSLAPAVTKFMQGLTEAMESPKNSWNVQGALETLQGQYQKLAQMNEGVFTQEYNQGILDLLDNAINAVGGTDFNKLSASQIEDVYSAVRSVLTAIRNENKMFAANLNKTYAEAAAAVLREESALPNRKPTTGAVQDKAEKFGWNQLKPVYAMMRLGSDTLLKQYNNLRAGEDKWQRVIAAARAYGLGIMEKYHYDQWNDSLMKLDTETGTVELSLEERMSLYAYARREQAFEHLTKGGFVLSDKNTRTVKNRFGIKTEQT